MKAKLEKTETKLRELGQELNQDCKAKTLKEVDSLKVTNQNLVEEKASLVEKDHQNMLKIKSRSRLAVV